MLCRPQLPLREMLWPRRGCPGQGSPRILKINVILLFRGLLAKNLKSMGVENFYVMDGIGGLLGFSPGERRPANTEIAMDLKPIFNSDGVHYSEIGYRNLAKTAVEAMIGTINGTLLRAEETRPPAAACVTKATTVQAAQLPAKPTYFWRGFSSPNGARGIASAPAASTDHTDKIHRSSSSERRPKFEWRTTGVAGWQVPPISWKELVI
jgi:hypothetical protein